MELKEEVKGIVVSILGISSEDIDYTTEIDEVAEWDSLHNLMIFTEIQEHFGVEIPGDDLFDLVSIEAIAEEIEKLK